MPKSRFSKLLILSPLTKPRFNHYLLASPLTYKVSAPKDFHIKNPLSAGYKPSTLWTVFFLTLYLCLCTWMFFAWAKPEAEGLTTIRLGADSATYYSIGNAIEHSTNKLPLLSLDGNLIGPISLVLLLKDPLLIALFNLTLLLIALRVASSIRGVRFHIFAALLMLNAETSSAITTVNKEIFSLFGVVLFAKYIEKKSNLLLFVSLVASIMARWEQVVIILLFLMFQAKSFRDRPKTALAILIFGITLAYPMVASHADLSSFEAYAEGGNTIAVLNKIQSSFGYFLVVVPKSLMNLFGNVATPTYWFTTWPNMDRTDIQNVFLIRMHEFAMSGVLLWAFLRKRITLKSPIIFFIAIYLVVTSANLFVQSRYDYPVYILICLEAAKPLQKVRKVPVREQERLLVAT